jgi:hypothetical protein
VFLIFQQFLKKEFFMKINFGFFRVMAAIAIAAGVVFGQTDINELIDPNFNQEVTENEQVTASLQTNSNTEIGVKVDLSQFLLISGGFRDKGFYHKPDGTGVKYKQVREMISIVPENEIVLKQEKAWRTTGKIFLGVFIASLAATSAAGFIDNDDNNRKVKVYAVTIPTGVFSFLYTGFCGIFANFKLQKAVDNYNYHIAKQSER